jgi:3-hydroxyacyl-CoA dehydrogenase
MRFVWKDIDQLLDDTIGIEENTSSLYLKQIDIDLLLEHTEHLVEGD